MPSLNTEYDVVPAPISISIAPKFDSSDDKVDIALANGDMTIFDILA